MQEIVVTQQPVTNDAQPVSKKQVISPPPHRNSIAVSSKVRRKSTKLSPGDRMKMMKRARSLTGTYFTHMTKRLSRSFDWIYELKREVAHDSFGELVLATHRKTGVQRIGRIVMKADVESQANMLGLLTIEMTNIQKIDHPNLMKFTELLEDDSAYYLLSEPLIEREFVSHNRIAGKLSEPILARLMIQLLGALRYCQARSIQLKTISLNSVLFFISKYGKYFVKVIGAGAGRRSAQDKDASINGVLAFSAPETLKGTFSEKTDIWACGVIAYYLGCGQLPFQVETKEELRYEIKNATPQFPLHLWGGFSIAFPQLLTSMLCSDPETRISPSEILAHTALSSHYSTFQSQSLSFAFANMRTFRCGSRLRMQTLSFLAETLLLDETRLKVTIAFRLIDGNGDQTVDKHSLKSVYFRNFSDVKTEEALQNVLTSFDPRPDGFLTFPQFQLATSGLEPTLSESRLCALFELLSQTSSGSSIRSEKLMTALKYTEDDEHWNALITACGLDSESDLDLKKFVQVIKTALK